MIRCYPQTTNEEEPMTPESPTAQSGPSDEAASA